MFLRNCILSIGLIIILLSVSYSPLYSNFSFVWDDSINLTENERIRNVTAESVLEYWKKPFLKLYIPVTYTVWSILWATVSYVMPDDTDDRMHAQVFHLTNLCLHILNTILLFFILSLLLKPGYVAGFIGALVFGVHPVQVESVAFITELRTLLSCFFSLLSIYFYLTHHMCKRSEGEKNTPGGATGQVLSFKRGRYYLSLLFFILALLSKPISVVIPLFLFLMNHFFFDVHVSDNVRSIWPWIVFSLLVAIITRLVQTPEEYYYVAPLWARPLIASDAALFYVSKVFYPEPLGIDYARTPAYVLTHWWGYVSWVVLLGALLMCWRVRKEYPVYVCSFLIFVAGFLPVSGLVSFTFQQYSTVADRYLYFSMIGPAMAVAFFLRQEKNVIHLLPVFVIAGLMMIMTYSQTKTWEDGVSLYSQALRVNPKSYWARNNLANYIKTYDLFKAISLYREAIEMRPDFPLSLGNMARSVVTIKKHYPDVKLDQLVKRNQESVEKESEYMNRGIETFMNRDAWEALRNFGRVIGLNILHARAYNNAGVSLVIIGNYNGAMACLEAAVTLMPHNPEGLNNLAIVYYYKKNKQESLQYFDRALNLARDNTAISANRKKALHGLGEELYTGGKRDPAFELLLQE